MHSYAQFEEAVINSSSKLFGGARTYVQLQKDRDQLLKVFPNCDEPIKRMKKVKSPISRFCLGRARIQISAKKFHLQQLPVIYLSCAHDVFDVVSAESTQ